MPSAKAARSSRPKKVYNGGRPNGVSSPGSAIQRGPTTKGYNKRNKKVPKAKSRKPGKPYHQPPPDRKQLNDVHSIPKHNMLLHRLSPPSSPSLLERIGGSAEDEVVRMSGLEDNYTDLPFSTVYASHFYTPEPDEVERFLESVIGEPPGRPVSMCLGKKPSLALETHNLPADHPVTVQDPSSSVLYSPTQTAVNSLPSTGLMLDLYQHSPLLGDAMAPPSPSTIEECRKHLVPVLAASAQTRDPAKHLDSEQCHRLLSDDHCKDFFRKAKEMAHQLSSLVSQKTPVHQGWSRSLKRDRTDDVDAWVRNTRSRFNSVNTDASRRDSDITLVDFPGGRLPPKAPRSMLQASQASRSKSLNDAKDGAPYNALVASPTIQDPPPSATSLMDLVHQAIKTFPALVSTSEPMTDMDTLNVPVGTSTELPGQVVSPTLASPATSTDFVSHLPTQPGIWFRQQGTHHAEIVDVDIDVSDDMFYMSNERLRMYLRLCSLPINPVTENNTSATSAPLEDVVEGHALHWPKKGNLVVQVNPESERCKTWLPYTLDSGPLDVTSCIRPGKNTFRFIQLSDLSKFTFVLAASPPPPEEEWRSWDWASLVEPRSSSTDDRVNDLSQFAHIPVIIRS